ncbi:hypothetical protein M0805_006042 [Coniferiporia weirii]|nr:hypothetical protein M0805_006042 [Coniferiporia weirii]
MISTRVHSGDIYRLFLQAAMSRRIMPEDVAMMLWRKCTEAVANAAPTKNIQFVDGSYEWGLFLNNLTKLLDPLSLEFRCFRDETTRVAMYAIVNTKGDEAAQLATDFNPAEIAFFKAIVEQIVLAPNYAFSVSSLAALREVSHLKAAMTKAQGEIVLASFVARGWLVRSTLGRYSLGTRSIIELGAYLKNTYDEVELPECTACMELVTKGLMCRTPNCKVRLHKHCKDGIKDRCPACQQQWPSPEDKRNDKNAELKVFCFIGEEATKHGQDERRRTRRTSTGDADDGESMDASQYTSQPSQAQSQPQPQSQPQGTQNHARTGKGKKANKKVNGQKKRNAAPVSDEEVNDMYEDDTMDIDDLSQIQEKPSRVHRRS